MHFPLQRSRAELWGYLSKQWCPDLGIKRIRESGVAFSLFCAAGAPIRARLLTSHVSSPHILLPLPLPWQPERMMTSLHPGLTQYWALALETEAPFLVSQGHGVKPVGMHHLWKSLLHLIRTGSCVLFRGLCAVTLHVSIFRKLEASGRSMPNTEGAH